MHKSFVSGIKPTGDIHIANYFGAMKQFLDLQESQHGFVMIVDLHALNQIHYVKQLSENIFKIITAYLAIGLDPKKVTLFQQSAVPAHSELCWIFNSITPMGTLERAHAYKDALAKDDKSIKVGLFDYPMLMAADILLYKPDIVPVGKDQQQHVEIAADTAERFNHLFGETFVVPKPMVMKDVATITGLDGRKMSKSYNNVIGLFDPLQVVQKKVMSIVTDSKAPSEPKDPDTCNIFALHKLVTPNLDKLAERYRAGEISYKESKELLFESLSVFLKPIQEKKLVLDEQRPYIKQILEEGRVAAEKVANQTLMEVKERTGLIIP